MTRAFRRKGLPDWSGEPQFPIALLASRQGHWGHWHMLPWEALKPPGEDPLPFLLV